MNGDIRLAASVMVLRCDAEREGPEGTEVLVLERSHASRFLGGYLVFPGGSVDEADTRLAQAWFGNREEAARAAAVRELAEETALALTDQGLRAAPGGPTGAFEAVAAAPPRLEMLIEAARWIAPPDVPVRFDARYFTVITAATPEPVPDGIEASRAWWARPQDLLSAWSAGEVRLYWPTWLTLAKLAEHLEASDQGAPETFRLETREPTDEELGQMPASTFWEDTE
jgi:8-oxo-dGTP pyrophosphatase MutT (NUDIX family)